MITARPRRTAEELTETTRLLLEMRKNCLVDWSQKGGYDDPGRKEKAKALDLAMEAIGIAWNKMQGKVDIMELKDTIAMMDNDDYKERFKAEYYQVKIRLEKLKAMLDKWDKGELNFTPTCPRDIYDFQVEYMTKYMQTLVIRASIEKIDLSK